MKTLIALIAAFGLSTAFAADAKKEEAKKAEPAKAEAKKDETPKPKVKPVGKDGKPVDDKAAAPAAKAEPAKK
jgi:hypothetical protein